MNLGKMDNDFYDKLKLFALLILPIASFVTSVCGTWGIPYGDQISDTLKALNVLIGAVVVIAKQQYDANGGQE